LCYYPKSHTYICYGNVCGASGNSTRNSDGAVFHTAVNRTCIQLWKCVWYCWQSHTHMRWKPCFIPLQITHVIRERTVRTMFFHRTHYFLSNRVYNDFFPPCLIFIFSLIYYLNLKFQILNYKCGIQIFHNHRTYHVYNGSTTIP
jgi:hypothetical protein